MDSSYFIEEKWYKKPELAVLFSEKDLQNLIMKGILISENNSFLKFVFVGVVSLRNLTFVILPKIFKKEQIELLKVKTTVQTLKRYSNLNFQKFDGIDYFNTDPDDPDCSEMAIADYLINDFQRHGVFSVEQELVELNANGDVNWPLTVLFADPIFSKGQPIYLNTINHVLIDDSEHLTIAIHKWSLGYSLKKYSILLGQDFDKIDFDYVQDSKEIGTDEQLIRHLKNQLQLTYTDRGIRLLKSLLFLIISKASIENESMSLYGTKKYEGVWEAICKTVVNDIYPQLKKDHDFFPNPIWNILGKTLASKSPLIPDIITKNDSTGKHNLFDAKYYMVEFNNSIKGEPGFKDILKQFQYQEHIELKLGEMGNGFLFPISNSNYDELIKNPVIIESNEFMTIIGHIEYHLYPGKEIRVIMCPFTKWQELFINNKSLESAVLLF
jgi:hypothetical protein